MLTRRKKILFALIPLLLLLLCAEVGVRLYRGRLLSSENARKERYALLSSAYPVAYDERLGWIPKQGAEGTKNIWGTRVTIGKNGCRSNGSTASASPILSVGDSFTFGDEVNDNETWPAHLQQILSRRVVNAGVFGYGLDQSVLRAETILREKNNIDVLIVGMIADDINRCELACRNAWKPYFKIDKQGKLVLANVPVPEQGMRPSRLKWLLGYSYLADSLCSRTVPGWWHTNRKKVRAHYRSEEVARLLLDRLAKLKVKAILLIQPTLETDQAEITRLNGFASVAESLGLRVINLLPLWQEKLKKNPGLKTKWFGVHMTSVGNRWVAEKVAAEIMSNGM